MHQIDVMVEKKRVEWEHQLHGMQIQCQQKEQEVVKLREMLEMRNKEVGKICLNFSVLLIIWGNFLQVHL